MVDGNFRDHTGTSLSPAPSLLLLDNVVKHAKEEEKMKKRKKNTDYKKEKVCR